MSKKSNIFYSEIYKKLEQKILEVLNGQPDFLSVSTVNSPRAVGDAVQDILAVNFEKIIDNLGLDYSAKFARRAMADLAFNDNEGFYYVVDVKTHRLDTVFNMPNLTSVERLARFYEDDSNYFVILKIDYAVKETRAEIKSVTFVPIEYLSWDCLTIGALGWGQIQIANSNVIHVIPQSRRKWMIQLCDTLIEFYPNEIVKIKERIKYFERVKE